MNNYKIVFSDVDGTLLNTDHKVTKLTNNAIKTLKEKFPIQTSFYSTIFIQMKKADCKFSGLSKNIVTPFQEEKT